ncbi:MAG: hypothetical protein L3J96_04045 [Thermoplasmata archaeon]|nr:hypothetical protein [Thermoplasmata archaeon]
MNRSDLLWLAALVAAVVFVALQPLISFSIFGSDTGEYYRLTSDLVATGHLPTGSAYTGWGFAYPDFPGTFILAGASAQSMGVDTFSALIYVIPTISVLSVLPLFLLFRRLVPNDQVAILGAGFASFAMPRMFSLAHPAPLAIGDAFVIASLWMFIEGRRDVRWYLPLTLTAGALIVTHHLSSYFFLVSGLGGLVILELWRPMAWSRRMPVREFLFLAGFFSTLVAFWIGYARDFSMVISGGGYGLSPLAVGVGLLLGGWVLLAVLFLVIRWRRGVGRPRRAFVRLPSDRSVLRDLLLILVATFVGVGVLVLYPLPGSMQRTSVQAILFFSPILVTLALAAGSRRLVTVSRLGPFAITWLAAISLSAIFALVSSNPVFIPSRHAEYLLIPLGLLVAVALGRWVGRLSDRAGRTGAIAGGVAVVLLLAANAAIAYPPPSDFGGFQEGLTPADATLWMWAGVGLPASATVASDHRLSSMIFGFDGNQATWDSTPRLFTGTNRTTALVELEDSLAPHAPNYRPINAVAIDATMRTTGVALDPSQLTQPMTPQASAWFTAPPFVPLYENGAQSIYWVDGPVSVGP